mmetsp:Transcript_16255/g.7748  ORF Transcript_16255/g.7748 Transcript_16255/m.7748 type:complete len:135 (+) Transcript_16255:291-695(+)
MHMLLHIVGDLHQPVSLYNGTFPSGDSGGNSFPVDYNYSIHNLHSLWDKACGFLRFDINRPLTDYNWDRIRVWAEEFATLYPREALAEQLAKSTFDEWATESYHVAKAVTYQDIDMGARPSDVYITTCETACKK